VGDHGGVVSTEPLESVHRADVVANGKVTAAIVEFLHDIGLETRANLVEGAVFMPGITVSRAVIVFDAAELKYPGDLLHEAGHLAVKPPRERRAASGDMGSDPAEEMMAIARSYAAALEIGLPPEVGFHPHGYSGAQSLIDNFSAGRYIAVPMLQWVGMALDERHAAEAGVVAYPTMTRWLCQT
jgi:hypothetical protein